MSERRTATGHRERRWDTRLGSLTLNIPKVRNGGYVPSFIEHRKRSEQALISVIQEAGGEGSVDAKDRVGAGADGQLPACLPAR
ncbi:MAG: transposase [Ignavibacteriota bacterium]